MNQRAFRRALRYGFGRAILHLRSHDAARYRDDILDGCLHNWGYGYSIEDSRPDYMVEIIALTGERAFYRDRILAAVASARDDHDGHFVFALARRFADAGDEAARVALDRALERLPFCEALAERAMALHGPAGLVRVVRLQLDRLDVGGDARDGDETVKPWLNAELIEEATERWGKRAVAAAVRDAGRTDPRIKRWWTDYRHEEAKRRQERAERRQAEAERPPLTYAQVKQYLAGDDSVLVGGLLNPLHTWRKWAPDDEWRRLAADLADLSYDDPRWQLAVDTFYQYYAYPGDPHRLIATVRATRLDRYRPSPPRNDAEFHAVIAIKALARMTHPAVRSFALELLETSKWTPQAASLLERNYEDGDLELLARAFRRERSEYQRHRIAESILHIEERFAPAGALSVLLYLYEHVRSAGWRRVLLTRLHAHGALPAAIAAECCFDADFGIRERIAELVPGACAGSDD